jgi:hypothetical protein
MTLEAAVSALTTATTELTIAVGIQQDSVTEAVIAFNGITTRVESGLNNVNNTTDISKPVSSLTQSALNAKQSTLISGVNISTVNGQSLLGGAPLVIQRSATSINYVSYDDRATLRALAPELDDSTVVPGLGLFQWVNSTNEPDDDETCFTTSAGQWLLQAPAWDLVDAWNLIEKSITDDFIEDESIRFAAYLATK